LPAGAPETPAPAHATLRTACTRGARPEAVPVLLQVLPTSDAHRPGFDVSALRRLQPHLGERVEGHVAREEALQHATERHDADAFEGRVIRGDGDLEAARITGRARSGHPAHDGAKCYGTQAFDLACKRRVV